MPDLVTLPVVSSNVGKFSKNCQLIVLLKHKSIKGAAKLLIRMQQSWNAGKLVRHSSADDFSQRCFVVSSLRGHLVLCPLVKMVGPPGVEPGSTASEAVILSIVL